MKKINHDLSNFPYGKCKKCHGAIAIPGGDAYLCSQNCGWIERKTGMKR